MSLFKIELRDGTPVQIRPVEPGDRHLLELGMENLSDQSRYNRFFRHLDKLSDTDLDTYSGVDQVNHIAIGALDLTHNESYPIGVARCIRMPVTGETGQAEVGVAVIDSHQGKGLGTILLATVACAAAAQNIGCLVATVLRSNWRMLKLFDELAAARTSGSRTAVDLQIPIHVSADKYPDTPAGRSFKRVYGIIGCGVERL